MSEIDSGPQSSESISPPVRTRLALPTTSPIITYIFLAANILVYVSSTLIGSRAFLEMGAKINEAIAAGEVWRLLTAMFLHVDLLHIGFNSYALYVIGPQVERSYGHVRFLLAYFMCGLAGNALSFALSPSPSVGASGAIFGLIAIAGSFFYRYRNRIVAGRSRLADIVGTIAVNLALGFTLAAVDNWAHIGGLLAGFALGWLLAPRYRIVHLDPSGSPRIVDQSTPLQWLQGVIPVSIGIGLIVLGGLLRWR